MKRSHGLVLLGCLHPPVPNDLVPMVKGKFGQLVPVASSPEQLCLPSLASIGVTCVWLGGDCTVLPFYRQDHANFRYVICQLVAQPVALAAIFASMTRWIKRFVLSTKAKWSARQLSSSTPTPWWPETSAAATRVTYSAVRIWLK